MFKENAGVKRHDLWNEFYAQLSKEQRVAYVLIVLNSISRLVLLLILAMQALSS
jgi:hypothetical protein